MSTLLSPKWILLLLASQSTLGLAPANAQSNATAVTKEAKCIIVELYLSDDQAASEMALAGAQQVARTRAGIKLVPRSIDTSEKGRERLKRIAQYFKFDETSTPVIYCGNRLIRSGKSAGDFEHQLRSALRIEVFTRIGCSKCKLAKAWLPTLQKRYPGMEVVYREITNDASARQDLNHLVIQYQKAATSTPVFHFCNQMLVGFDRAETTGSRIEQALRRWSTTCPSADQTKKERADQSSVANNSVLGVASRVPFSWQPLTISIRRR